MAEAEGKHCYAVTLTYGRDETGQPNHPKAQVLHYGDVQRFLKRVRKSCEVRYFIAGEYGGEGGRAHWHCLLFFNDKLKVSLRERINHRWWPEGFSFWEKAGVEQMAYVCKYIQKGKGAGAHCIYRMSKKPPLGHEYLTERAARHARKGFPLSDRTYEFSGVTDSRGARKRFYLDGVSWENYVSAYVAEWLVVHKQPPTLTEPLIQHFDSILDTGKSFGEIKEEIEAKQIDGSIPSSRRHIYEHARTAATGGVLPARLALDYTLAVYGEKWWDEVKSAIAEYDAECRAALAATAANFKAAGYYA